MPIRYKNRREKLANLIIDVVKYILTVIGVGAILPGSQISLKTAGIGVFLALTALAIALWITPEE